MRQLLDGGPTTASELAHGTADDAGRQSSSTCRRSARPGWSMGTREGREVHYRAMPEPMGDAVAWMLRAGAQWDRRLERLRRQLSQRTG